MRWSSSCSVLLILLSVSVSAQQKPAFAPGFPITNAAGGANEFAPGSIVFIRGTDLAAHNATAVAPYPTTLAGASVSITQSGATFSAAIFDAQPGRLTIQLPYGLKRGSSTLKLTAPGGEISRGLPIIDAAPRPVTTQVGALVLQEAYHADGRGVTEAEPAKAGEVVSVIVQGLGETTPPIQAGALPGDGSDLSPYHQATLPLSARLDQTPADVKFIRLLPGRPGQYEVGLVIPDDVRAGLYLFALKLDSSDWISGGALWSGGRVIPLTKVANGQDCSPVDSAPLRLPYDAYLHRIEARVQMSSSQASFAFRLVNEAGEEVLASTLIKQSCDAGSEWCLAARQNLKLTLPAGGYRIVSDEPRFCVNEASSGQPFSTLFGAWAPSNWQLQTEGWILPEGGAVEAPGLVISAQPGAFDGSAPIKVSTVVREEEPSQGRITPYFKLEGIPAEPAAPITLTLDAPGAPDGDVTLMMRLEDSAGSPVMLSGTVSGGKLTVALPADAPESPSSWSRAARSRSASLTKNSKVSWMLWAVAGLKPNNFEEHFIIHSPDSAYDLMRKAGPMLEKAYSLIASMGLDWAKRGDAPIEVYLFSYSSWSSLVLGGVNGAAGNSETGVWSKDNIGLCLNLDQFAAATDQQLEDLAITAGHELLHIMQAQYEGGFSASSNWLWLEEAAATWLERALSSNDSFISGNAKDSMYFLFTDPLEVNHWYGREAARRHGYGASLYLQSLAPASPGVADARVGSLFKRMAEDPQPTPVEALEKAFGPLHESWWEFCDRYVGGAIISGFPAYGDLTGGAVKPVAWTLSKTATSGKELRAYPHLSARLFQIRFDAKNPPELGDQSTLRLKLTSQGLAKAFVYVLRGAEWQRAGEFTALFELENLKSIVADGATVFVMVSNGSHIFPNYGTTDIEFEARVDGPFEGVNSYDTAFHGVLYNGYYELDFTVSITGSAPFKIDSSTPFGACCLSVNIITPPVDVKTFVPGEDQIDSYTVTIQIANWKKGPKAPGGWVDGMLVKAGFDERSAMVVGLGTRTKTYRVIRGGKSVSSIFLTETFWPDGLIAQGGSDTPVNISFTPVN